MNDMNFYKKKEITELTNNNLTEIIDQITSPYMLNSRDRPYDGQPHTDQGERGKELVIGLTMRDIFDCFIKGMLLSSTNHAVYDTVKDGTWQYSDVYAIGNNDPIAAGQNMMCCIEEMMIEDGNMKSFEERFPIYLERCKE